MRLLTKFSLASIAALAVVVALLAIVGIRVFDSISHQNHIQILNLQIAAVAHDANAADSLANDALVGEIMQQNELELGARLFAYRTNGRRIYPPEKQTSELPATEISDMLESAEGGTWIKTATSRYLVAWRLERSDDLLFGALLPEAVVYSERARYLSGISGAALVVFLTGACAFVLVGRTFSQRVARTVEALDKMRRGEFGARIAGVRGNDELSGLQRLINDMANHIARRARDSEVATQWLRENESRFRDFAEATVDAFWETDADLRYSWFSNQGLAFPDNPENNPMLGKKRGQYFENIKASEGDWAGHLDDLENRRTFRNFQFSGVLANGAVFHRVSSGTPYYDDDGNFAGYRGTTSDVTARVETERRLSNLIANIPGLVFQRLIHPDDRIEYSYLSGDTVSFFGSDSLDSVNEAARSMSFVHPEDRDRLRAAFIDGARSGKPSSVEFRHVLPDGEVIWIQLNNAAATRRPDGVLVQDGFSVNVTNLKNAEHAARLSQDRLLGFMMAASDTLWESDSEHRITWLSDPENMAVRHLDKNEMIGRRRWEFPTVASPDGPHWQRHREDLKNRRPIRDFEFETQLEDGTSVFRRVSGNPIFDDSGTFIGYRGVSTDITERVLAGREAQAAEQRLTAAIQSTDQGVALFDADDRLIFVNNAYQKLQPLFRDLFITGRRFEDIMTDLGKRGSPTSPSEGLESWLARRLAYHRNPVGPFATVVLNDRHIEIRDERLPDGGSMLRLTDVSFQVEAQRALKESEERFRDFAEASSDWLWEMDADFRFVWHSADDDPGESLGPTAVGKTPWEYLGVDVDQDERFQRHIDDLLARRPFRDFRYTKILRDGSVGYRSTSGTPHFATDGGFVGYRGTTTDITEQVEAELRYRNLIEQTPAPVIVHGKYVIKFANSAALAMFGAEREDQIVGQAIIDFVHPDDHDLFKQRLNLTIDEGAFSEISEQRRLRLDGSEIHVITRGVPVVWEGERAVLGTQIDITDRIRAERQYRELIQNAPMPITIDDGSRFLLVNDAFVDLFRGGSVNDVIGRPIVDMAHPEDITDFHERVRAVSRFRQTLPTSEIKRRRFDGETITVLSRGVPIVWEGEPATLGMQVDISDRIAAQNALQDSEERFRNLVEGSRQGVLLHVDFQPVFANAALADMFGYDSKDEILALESILALVAPENWEQWREYRHMRLQGLDAPESYEFSGVRKDGSRIWLHMTVRVVAWEGHTALQGTLIDITDQRKAVEAIRDSEERFRVLTAMSPVGVFVTDRDGNCEYVNEAYQNMAGLTLDEAAGKGWVSAIHPADRDRVSAEWYAATQGSKPFRTEFRFLRDDGAVIWGIAQAAAQRDASGAVVNFIGAVTDVTARRETEQALESSEERFRMLTMLSPVGVFLTDPQGEVEYVNEALSHMLGMPAAAAKGNKWINGIHPDDRRKIISGWRNAVRDRNDLEIEIRMGNGNDDVRWVFVQASPLMSPTGRSGGYVGAVTDITDRRIAEEKLRQVQKMDAIGQLTGGIAHDFNNLLAIVQGNLELLRERAPEEQRVQSLIEAAHGAAKRGATLNQRLLAFARRQPLRPVKCDINAIVEDMTGLFSRTLGENVELRTNYAAGLWHAKVDPNGLETAVLNLAINGRDAMPDGGVLTISTENARYRPGRARPVKDLMDGDYIIVRVTDTGSGMDTETIEKAFDPFFTTKGIGKGSGLGLSMVYGFVHQSDGRVAIESVPGQGTSITLYFPKDDEEDAPLHERRIPAAAPPGEGERILVVEDDAEVLDMAVEMFSSLNYRTVVASCAEDALNILEARDDIELLFTDVLLANGENGPDLAKRARKKFPELRVLFTSGYAETKFSSSEPIEAGALLSKPYERLELARAVRAALETGNA